MSRLTSDDLLPEIGRAIEREVARTIEAAVDSAADQLRAALRERLGAITCGLLSQYSIERRGVDLIITVKIAGDGA